MRRRVCRVGSMEKDAVGGTAFWRMETKEH